MVDSVDGDGNPIKVIRDGVSFSWWSESGKAMIAKSVERAPQSVAQVADPEFAFNVGPTPPAWVTTGLYVIDDDGTEIGTFDRIQGNFAVFTLSSGATLPAVNDQLTPVSPPEFLGGQVLLLRIHGDFFQDQVIVPDEADPDKEKQWARNKVAKYIKDNGTGPDTFDLAGTNIPYYELDGVKLTEADIFVDALKAAGLPWHEWLGGNSY
jgi:hypothetical protein